MTTQQDQFEERARKLLAAIPAIDIRLGPRLIETVVHIFSTALRDQDRASRNAALVGEMRDAMKLSEQYVESAWFRAGNDSHTYAAKTTLDSLRALIARADKELGK